MLLFFVYLFCYEQLHPIASNVLLALFKVLMAVLMAIHQQYVYILIEES